MAKLFVYIVVITYSFSMDFELQNYSAIVNIGSLSLHQPFTGGTNYARISWFDWDSDGDMDLFLIDEDRFFKYFENNSDIHQFHLKSHPIQKLSGMSWFYLHDFNGDGNVELATQSTLEPTEVMYFQYSGNEFEYVSTLYQSDGSPLISASAMTPTFSDIDADGDLDFFTGNTTGTVNYYECVEMQNGVPIFEHISSSWEDILIVGRSQDRHGASAITFIDLDGDMDLDLAWGDFFQRSLYIIWNIGSAESPDMDPENFTSEFPESNPIFTSGQNMPSFADLDQDDDMDLFITVLGGDGPLQLNDNFLMYENIGSATNPDYYHVTDNFLGSLDLLSDVVPQLIDIDNDGNLDLFVGQDYTTETDPTMGRLYFFENNNLAPTTWTLMDSAFLGENIGLSLSPEFIDIDLDADLDLFVGDYNGRIKYFRNTGTIINSNFIDEGYINDIDLSFFSVPEFCDLDNDGDYDLFIGNYTGGIHYFENIGSSEEFNFEASDINIPNISDYGRTAPRFIDLDEDADFDLIIGTNTSGLIIYWNTGDQNSYTFIKDNCIEIPYSGYNLKPTVGDINNDGIQDLIVGASTGGFLHYTLSRMGDVNLDVNLDIFDIISIINHILFQSDSEIICRSDLNHDEVLDVGDILLILEIILL